MALPLSARYRDLAARVATLRRALLPARFSATGQYAARVHDRTRAFQVLAHAELEAYFEERAKAVSDALRQRWRTVTSTPPLSRPALHMLWKAKEAAVEKALQRRSTVPSASSAPVGAAGTALTELALLMHDAITKYDEAVRANHGIREVNLRNILTPVGVGEHDLDPSWIASLDAFGLVRGAAAHTSAVGIVLHPDPATEWQRALDIVRGAKAVDRLLSSLAIEAAA